MIYSTKRLRHVFLQKSVMFFSACLLPVYTNNNCVRARGPHAWSRTTAGRLPARSHGAVWERAARTPGVGTAVNRTPHSLLWLSFTTMVGSMSVITELLFLIKNVCSVKIRVCDVFLCIPGYCVLESMRVNRFCLLNKGTEWCPLSIQKRLDFLWRTILLHVQSDIW